jgi:hypothetical protein
MLYWALVFLTSLSLPAFLALAVSLQRRLVSRRYCYLVIFLITLVMDVPGRRRPPPI